MVGVGDDRQAFWNALVESIIATWPQDDIMHQQGHENAADLLAAYSTRVQQFVLGPQLAARADSARRSPMVQPAAAALPPGLGYHLAHLCVLFNWGGAVRLACAAETPQIVADMLDLFESFKLLSSLLHSGKSRAALQGSTLALPSWAPRRWRELEKTLAHRTAGAADAAAAAGSKAAAAAAADTEEEAGEVVRDALEAELQQVMEGHLFAGMHAPARYAAHGSSTPATACSNCTDPLLVKMACSGCLGPRCSDNVRVAAAAHGEFRSKRNYPSEALLYYDSCWGWEWSVHSLQPTAPLATIHPPLHPRPRGHSCDRYPCPPINSVLSLLETAPSSHQQRHGHAPSPSSRLLDLFYADVRLVCVCCC